jgi:hypothetical protein
MPKLLINAAAIGRRFNLMVGYTTFTTIPGDTYGFKEK